MEIRLIFMAADECRRMQLNAVECSPMQLNAPQPRTRQLWLEPDTLAPLCSTQSASPRKPLRWIQWDIADRKAIRAINITAITKLFI